VAALSPSAAPDGTRPPQRPFAGAGVFGGSAFRPGLWRS
jgi:hypothetical protein